MKGLLLKPKKVVPGYSEDMNKNAKTGSASPNARNTDSGQAGSVRSVVRAIRLLGTLGPERSSASLTEFCDASGLPSSTVQRLLQTLESEHFLRREADGRYTFGTALVQLGLASLQSMMLYDAAKPVLEALSRQTGETANLGVLTETGEVMYIRQAISPRPIHHANWVGRPFQSKSTAMGAVLTGKAGAQGHFSTRNTQEPDVTAVAAPIYDAENDIVAGISVTGPSYRISDSEISRIETCVVHAAQTLTSHLGGRWPY